MKLSVVLLACLPVLASAQTKLSVSGKIKGLKEGDLVTITDVNRPADTIAKAKVKNGIFVLNGELKEPMLLNLNMGNGKTLMTFLDNSSVKVTGDIASLPQLKVSGSKLHNDFIDFKKTFDPLFEKLMKVNQELQMGNRSDSLAMVMNMMKDKIQSTIDDFIKKEKDQLLVLFYWQRLSS